MHEYQPQRWASKATNTTWAHGNDLKPVMANLKSLFQSDLVVAFGVGGACPKDVCPLIIRNQHSHVGFVGPDQRRQGVPGVAGMARNHIGLSQMR